MLILDGLWHNTNSQKLPEDHTIASHPSFYLIIMFCNIQVLFLIYKSIKKINILPFKFSGKVKLPKLESASKKDLLLT